MKKTISCLISALLVIASVFGAFTVTAADESVSPLKEGTVDFGNGGNILSSYSSPIWWSESEEKPEGTKPAVTSDNDGKTVLGLNAVNEHDIEKRVILPFKLEANKTYAYTINCKTADWGKVDFQLYSGANNYNCDGINNTLKVLYSKTGDSMQNSTSYTDIIGEFKTTQSTVNDNNSYLGIRFITAHDKMDLYIASVTLIKIDDEGEINFNDSTDMVRGWSNGSDKPAIVEEGENKALKIAAQSNKENRIGLPIMFKPDTTYKIKMKYKVDTSNGGATYFYLYSGNPTTSIYCNYEDNTKRRMIMESYGSSISNTEYVTKEYNLTTTSDYVHDEYNKLCIFLQANSSQTFYIDSICVTEIRKEGKIEFDFKDQILGSYSYNGATAEGTPAEVSNDNGNSVLKFSYENSYKKDVKLPFALESGKNYTYSVRYRVDKEANSGADYFRLLLEGNVVSTILNGTRADNTEYSVYTGKFTAAKNGNPTIRWTAMGSGQTLYIDSVSIEIQKGDLNKDGEINITDLDLLRKVLLNVSGLTYDATEADVNKDGEIDIRDLVALNSSIS